jgi:hypothetical protein
MPNRELTDTPTIAWDGSVVDEAKANVVKQMSVTSDASGLKLVGDLSAPGNSKVYGTDSSGNRGWQTPSGGGGGGGLVLVEKKLITSNSTTVTFSSLDGDTDEVYRLVCRLINNSGGTTKYTLQPNGVTTNQSSAFRYDTHDLPRTIAATLQLSDNSADVTNGTWLTITIDFWAKKNPNSVAAIRQFHAQIGVAPAASLAHVAGVWNETATNVTSLVVAAANTNGIGNGSTMALYKYAQS